MNAPQSSATRLLRPLRPLLRFVFGSGVVLLLLAQIITFIPGAEERFYIFTGCLLLAGLVLPGWPCRIVAVVLIAYCIWGAVEGQRRGIKYRSLLEQKGLSQPRR
jgi:hypothetical protein